MKFIIDNIWLITITVVAGAALLLPTLQRRGQKVTTLQATQMINQGKTMLLDVRDAADFAEGHVRDAINIPHKDLPARIAELEKWKSKAVIAMCYSGITSARATSQLKNAGFAEVYSLDGGIAAWRTQGLPVIK